MTVFRYYVASTLDGFIADPDDGIEWLLGFGMEEYGESYAHLIAKTGALVMGSHTYEFVLGQDEAWPYGELPTWVLTSRDLPSIPGAQIRFAAGEVSRLAPRIAESAGGKDVWIVGGGAVAGRFAEAGSLDEIVVTVMPVLLGDGKRIITAHADARPLQLTDSRVYGSGAVELTYRVGADDRADTDDGRSR